MSNVISKISVSVALLLGMAACQQGKTTSMVTKSDNLYQKISYSGRVVFNKDQTGIESIAKDGFVKFERNGRKMEAETDGKGSIVYDFDDADNVTNLNPAQQQFVTSAVKAIVKERNRQLGAKR